MVSRSASRTFCMITCLAVCAAMRPSTSVGFGIMTSLPTSALGSIFRASASVNSFHRQSNHPALHFDLYLAVGDTRQTAFKIFLILHGFRGRDSRQPPGESHKLRRLGQLAIESGRTHLKDIGRPRNQILNVENHAELIADSFAILVADAFGLIDV